MKHLRTLAILILLVVQSHFLLAQIEQPVSWNHKAEKTANNEYNLIFTATINDGWHLYSQNLPSDDGPIATVFSFTEPAGYETIGKVSEPKPHTEFDPNFQMEVSYFENKAVFTQKIKRSNNTAIVQGEIEFMSCNDVKCLPPDYYEFSFDLAQSEIKTAEKVQEKVVEEVISKKDNTGRDSITIDNKKYIVPLGNSTAFYKKYLQLGGSHEE